METPGNFFLYHFTITIQDYPELKAELSQLLRQLQKESETRRDYQVIRDKVLHSLKLASVTG